MPHGTPDWGLVGPKSTVYGLDDLGEHAVRGGSPHIWDRRGDVLLLDSFESGLSKPLTAVAGAGGRVVLFTGLASHGAFSVHLYTGPVDEDRVYLWYMHSPPVTSRMGFEYSFLRGLGVRHFWYWILDWYDAAWRRYARVRLDSQRLVWEYYDLNGVYQPFGALVGVVPEWQPWEVGKLVADFESGYYVRFIYNDTVYDLSPYPLRQVFAVVQPYVVAMIHFETQEADNAEGYIDAVIMTHNEP